MRPSVRASVDLLMALIPIAYALCHKWLPLMYAAIHCSLLDVLVWESVRT